MTGRILGTWYVATPPGLDPRIVVAGSSQTFYDSDGGLVPILEYQRDQSSMNNASAIARFACFSTPRDNTM